jgi:hypothetical protein
MAAADAKLLVSQSVSQAGERARMDRWAEPLSSGCHTNGPERMRAIQQSLDDLSRTVEGRNSGARCAALSRRALETV